jgi:hypothetical protein
VVVSPPPPHDHPSLWERYGAPICRALGQAGLYVTNSHEVARHAAGGDSPVDQYSVTVWVPDTERGMEVVAGVVREVGVPAGSVLRARAGGRVVTRLLA